MPKGFSMYSSNVKDGLLIISIISSFDVNVEKYVALVTSENDVNAVLADGLTDEYSDYSGSTKIQSKI